MKKFKYLSEIILINPGRLYKFLKVTLKKI